MIKQVRSWSKPDLPKIIGRKKIDWSIFDYGSHIPLEFHEDFAAANDNHFLKVGEKKSIKLILNGEPYEATLVYAFRKDSNNGSLDLRYEQNKKFKNLIKEVFHTSYEFFIQNRDDKTKKQIHTPEDKEEFIEFYQTEKPYEYKVILNSKNVHFMNTSFWWVNQGQTHIQEKKGGFLWAPKKTKRGISLPHHLDLVKAQEGDIVFCYSNRELKSVGIVTQTAIESPKPSSIESHEWQEEGNLLKLNYFDFNPTIQKEEIPKELRLNESGPFDRNGDIKQGYFFKLSDEFAKNLFKLFSNRFPLEVKFKMENSEPEHRDQIIKDKEISFQTSTNLIDHIHSYIKNKGFYYSRDEVINLFLSLKTKPFVILSGISGTGKTKMVQWFAESLGATEDNGQFTLIPIRPDWNDGSDLLGYVDIKGDFKEGPLTKVIRQALESPYLPFFILLDEMNLARVEYYFSDILSVMESRKWQNGEMVTSKLIAKEVTKYDKDLRIPSNLYIIGTVNMDETTHPFSKKVLDRANTIEFNRVDLGNLSFLNEDAEVASIPLFNEKLASKYLYLKDVYQDNPELVQKTTEELEQINQSLQIMNAHVGYRVRDEICFYLAYNEVDKLMPFDNALDHCILQKILPRITGSDTRVEQLLLELYKQFTNREFAADQENYESDFETAKYPNSASKVVEMLRRLKDDGFTSFWIS